MIRWLKFYLRNSFGYSRREANGTLILFTIMVLLLVAPFLFQYISRPGSWQVEQADRQKLDSLVLAMERQPGPIEERAAGNRTTKEKVPASRFRFDPNLATREEFQSLGIAPWLVERIDNYRLKGGRFRVKGDLQRIYGFPENLYAQLRPYINLPDTLARAPKPAYSRDTSFLAERKTTPRPIGPAPFDLNLADTTELKKIRGIGSGYSRRIISYRDKLGGFMEAEQLREVYGLHDTIATKVLQWGSVTPGFTPVQLDINTASQEELSAHPYIHNRVARLIIAYRQQHGAFENVDGLLQIKAISEEDIRRARPYLKAG
jgi:competence protein ComEA